MTTLREQILTAPPHRLEAVECPEWGTTVHVGVVTGAELRAVKALGDQHDDADLVVLVARDADGKRIFAPDDAEVLRDQPAEAVHRVAAAFLRINGWDGNTAKNS